MAPRADLFVVCKHCGAEVSPYITECPYCGQRLRRRAPKIPRSGGRTGGSAGVLSRLVGARAGAERERGRAGARLRSRAPSFGVSSRPYATIALVAASAGLWVATHGAFVKVFDLFVLGPLHGDWWKLFTSSFSYLPGAGLYAFIALLAIAIFGWRLELRHGPLVVLALFIGAGVSGALVALAVYPVPIVSGGNASALALLAAWAAPDVVRARSRDDYDGDLIGAGALGAILLVEPFARGDTSWLAGVTGGAIGALVGLGLRRVFAED
jgi:Rhomboid family/zinc-ribbon domain